MTQFSKLGHFETPTRARTRPSAPSGNQFGSYPPDQGTQILGPISKIGKTAIFVIFAKIRILQKLQNLPRARTILPPQVTSLTGPMKWGRPKTSLFKKVVKIEFIYELDFEGPVDRPWMSCESKILYKYKGLQDQFSEPFLALPKFTTLTRLAKICP